MAALIQRLVVTPGDEHRSQRDSPVQLINPDGSDFLPRKVAYLPEKTTAAALRQALLDAGWMESAPSGETEEAAESTEETASKEEETGE